MKKTVLALLLAATPVVAAGQSTASTDEVRKNARLHAGPVYLSPSLLLKELGVDTNVFNEADEEKSDFTFTLAPAVDVWVPIARRALFTSRLGTDFVWYANYDTERSIDPQASLRADVFVRRLTLFVEGAHQNSRQRLNQEIDVRARHVRNELTAGFDVKLTPKLSVETAARHSEFAFDADALFLGASLERALNRTTRAVALTARHRATPLTTVIVRAEQSRDEFEWSSERNADSIRVTPGVEFKPRALVSGHALIGLRRFSPKQRMLPSYTGLVAQLGLSHTMFGATTVGVSYTRDLQYSYEALQPYYVLDGVGGSVRQAIGSKFDVLATVDRHVHGYRNLLVRPEGAGLLPADGREDVTLAGSASLGYRLGRDGRIGVGASYQERQSNTQPLRDYTTVRFAATVSYGLK